MLNGYWSSSLSWVRERGFNCAEAPQREATKEICKGRTEMTSCQINQSNMDVLTHSNIQKKKKIPTPQTGVNCGSSASAYIKKKQRHNQAAGISDLTATHVRNSECAKITYVHEYKPIDQAPRFYERISGTPCVAFFPELLFYFSRTEKTHTKRSNHTGDPACNHGSVCLRAQWAARPFIY